MSMTNCFLVMHICGVNEIVQKRKPKYKDAVKIARLKTFIIYKLDLPPKVAYNKVYDDTSIHIARILSTDSDIYYSYICKLAQYLGYADEVEFLIAVKQHNLN